MYKWEDGSKFERKWNNGLMHWDSEYIWEDGNFYKGEWKDDKKTVRGAAESK